MHSHAKRRERRRKKNRYRFCVLVTKLQAVAIYRWNNGIYSEISVTVQSDFSLVRSLAAQFSRYL